MISHRLLAAVFGGQAVSFHLRVKTVSSRVTKQRSLVGVYNMPGEIKDNKQDI